MLMPNFNIRSGILTLTLFLPVSAGTSSVRQRDWLSSRNLVRDTLLLPTAADALLGDSTQRPSLGLLSVPGSSIVHSLLQCEHERQQVRQAISLAQRTLQSPFLPLESVFGRETALLPLSLHRPSSIESLFSSELLQRTGVVSMLADDEKSALRQKLRELLVASMAVSDLL